MLAHLSLPVPPGEMILLGGAGCATLVVDRSMPTPCSQDLSWRIIRFVWSLGLTREEVTFYRGVSTHGDNKIKRTLFY